MSVELDAWPRGGGRYAVVFQDLLDRAHDIGFRRNCGCEESGEREDADKKQWRGAAVHVLDLLESGRV
jgi:hypothetical protein